ncbi:hypothetical protein HZC07_04905 [Candidatus Micrarchaeota archaeon]|nr:hypothetical protein [Candidatus Micrarchaeota archaeon]
MSIHGKVTTICLQPGNSSGKQRALQDQLLLVIEGEASFSSSKESKIERKILAKDESIFLSKGVTYSIKNGNKNPLIYVCITGK